MNYTLIDMYWIDNTPENKDSFWNSGVKFDGGSMFFFDFRDEESITYAASEELTIDEFLEDDWDRILADAIAANPEYDSVTLVFKEWITQYDADHTGEYEPELNYEYLGLLDTTKLHLCVANKTAEVQS